MARRPRLAGPAIRRQRIYEGAARDDIVGKVAAILSTARSSKFEHEAVCRHALRQGLVLAGHHRWAVADLEAASIVSAALNAIGAIRPSWAMGQPEYVIGFEQCQHCATALPDEELAAGHRYCSAMCAASTKLYRREWHERTENITRQRIALVVARESAPERACIVCGNVFRSANLDARTCSPPCAAQIRYDLTPLKTCAHCGTSFRNRGNGLFCCWGCLTAARLAANPTRPCAHCGKPFRGHDAAARYCSNRCAAEGLKASLPIRACACCGTAFQPGKPSTIFCSQACAARDSYVRKKERAAAKAHSPP